MKNRDHDLFLEKYTLEKPMFSAWGNYVQQYIFAKLETDYGDISKLIKIKCQPRVKDDDSIIAKAFFRKNYNNAYEEITDKVGIRFVVMVDKQIKIIKDIIEEAEIWIWSKDQDYEEIIKKQPDIFSYQSVHYIVRNRNNITIDGITIEEGTPCEIQIRTLEQHAYAELSHDYIYKKEDMVNYNTKRCLARSMALNETTDELFSKVYDMMEKENEKYYYLSKFLKSLFTFERYSEKIDKNIYESIRPMIDEYMVDERSVKNFLTDYYKNNIQKRQDDIVYQQPMIIMLYYLAKEHQAELEQRWCFTQEMLVPIFSDLGITSNNDY